MNHKENIIRNVIRGQAIADAIGRPIEFKTNLTRADIKFVLKAPTLYISDDTQMALFGAEAITRWLTNGCAEAFSDVYMSQMIEWRNTQDGKQGFKRNSTWLGRNQKMQRIQAPGGTCLSSLAAWRAGKPVSNNSNGCGSVMKASPFGLMALHDGLGLEDIKTKAVASSLATHGSRQTASNINDYLDVAFDLMRGEINPMLKRVGSSGTHIKSHGAGWNATECLDMAMWAAYNAESFDHLLELSICHDGDSDSVASVAAALWGFAGQDLGKTEDLWDKIDERQVVDAVINRFSVIVAYA